MIRCGFYERCVTPPIGSEIPGYWCRRPSTGVLDEIYVKAFVTDDGAKQTALIVVDAVELLTKHTEAILKRVEEMTGIPADRVSVSCKTLHLVYQYVWDASKSFIFSPLPQRFFPSSPSYPCPALTLPSRRRKSFP